MSCCTILYDIIVIASSLFKIDSTREETSSIFDGRIANPRIQRQSLALVTAITIRLGKHPAGVSSGRTRPCPAVNLASAIISRVRWRPVPSRPGPVAMRPADAEDGRLVARVVIITSHLFRSRFRSDELPLPPLPPFRRGPYAGPLFPPTLRTILGCEEWQHAHIHHRSVGQEILHFVRGN